jgi:hypothetical protein
VQDIAKFKHLSGEVEKNTHTFAMIRLSEKNFDLKEEAVSSVCAGLPAFMGCGWGGMVQPGAGAFGQRSFDSFFPLK